MVEEPQPTQSRVPFRKFVFVCTNPKPGHCGEKGGQELVGIFKDAVAERGLKAEIRVTSCGCTLQHAWGPIVYVWPDGVCYKQVSPGDLDEIISEHLLGNRPVERLIHFIARPSEAATSLFQDGDD